MFERFGGVGWRNILNRIIFVNRYFAPDVSATSQILSDVAFHLAGCGCEVHVVCGDRLYVENSNRLPREEMIGGVRVHRAPGGAFGRARLAGRALDYLCLYAGLRGRVSEILRQGDVLVAKTDPPLLSVALSGLAQRRGASFIAWLQDLYPEVAGALSVPLIKGRFGKSLLQLRNRSLESAQATVVIGERMKERLIRQGLTRERVHLIHNWSDDTTINPIPPHLNILRTRWGLTGKFVVGYSGNLGRAHEFETVLAAAEQLRDREDLLFLLVGGGHQFEALKREVGRRSLSRQFQFRPYQDRFGLAQSLSAADTHWLSLRPELEGLIVPSKFYGIAAAGRPVINIGAPDGEIADLLRTYRCGVTIVPGDGAALARALEEMMHSPEAVSQMGAQARHMCNAQFSKSRALARWENLLAEHDVVPRREQRGW